jgi:hypothetical protein
LIKRGGFMGDNKRVKSVSRQGTEADSDESGRSGEGGQTGAIEFREFITLGEQLRDDLLPADEKKRLLIVHNQVHELGVKKQKSLREQRQAIKEGRVPMHQYGAGGGTNSSYLPHPELNKAAQFSGTDQNVNLLPTENTAEINQAQREELQNRYQLRYAQENTLKNTPRFNPKPQFNR